MDINNNNNNNNNINNKINKIMENVKNIESFDGIRKDNSRVIFIILLLAIIFVKFY